jgi:hypothetical protein
MMEAGLHFAAHGSVDDTVKTNGKKILLYISLAINNIQLTAKILAWRSLYAPSFPQAAIYGAPGSRNNTNQPTQTHNRPQGHHPPWPHKPSPATKSKTS